MIPEQWLRKLLNQFFVNFEQIFDSFEHQLMYYIWSNLGQAALSGNINMLFFLYSQDDEMIVKIK